MPEDALAGFLPPEDGTGRGKGYVSFTVNAKTNLTAGTQIKNKATIIFDSETPIQTAEVFNTITNAAAPMPGSPSLADGSTNVYLSALLAWGEVDYATAYDLYLWEAGQPRPTQPLGAGLTGASFDPGLWLALNRTYNWQVVARNIMGSSTGAVWTFTTEPTDHTLTFDSMATESRTVGKFNTSCDATSPTARRTSTTTA